VSENAAHPIDPLRTVVVEGPAHAFRQEIRVGRHALVSDEPLSAGGADAGPTPYDLLLSALGACTSMTLGIYARRKGWPLEAVRVRLRHARVHAADCVDCETKNAMIDRIDCEIELAGPLDAAQRARLLEIATRCPVHRTLTGHIEIRSVLATG
jgi:putative redox protein